MIINNKPNNNHRFRWIVLIPVVPLPQNFNSAMQSDTFVMSFLVYRLYYEKVEMRKGGESAGNRGRRGEFRN
ncbi:unnamed protein product [marine sediment metagenome]|uniref:Uncharacterized protein n=1 Tax=marine sediment metagenome TaxID=412755 RepID=X1BGK6_9ZZZZ